MFCIVTEVAGTTRDWVGELADVGGCPLWITDTAGLWDVELFAAPGGDAGDRNIDAAAVERGRGSISAAGPGRDRCLQPSGCPRAALVVPSRASQCAVCRQQIRQGGWPARFC